jgi:hypothetical protein
MSSHISAELRQLVFRRAGEICEYCLLHAEDMFMGWQVDHVRSEKHGGQTVAENLAMACSYCNQYKGSDVGSFSTSGELVRFYHPRHDRWSDQFRLVGGRIEWRTPVGEATVRLLRMNDQARIEERETLREKGRYPSASALARMKE